LLSTVVEYYYGVNEDVTDRPKYARVAAAVRGQIADGTLLPGQPAPSGAALSRVTGYSTLTCRRALRVLIADGVLIPGPSRNARPRVAGAAQGAAERDLAAAARALSAGLAARRRAARLTQPGLAVLAAVSVTTIGHAETGRLWQSRQFWERADAVLGAGGGLLRLHDAYRVAGSAGAARHPGGRPGADLPFAAGQLAASVPLPLSGRGAALAGLPGPAAADGPWPRGLADRGAGARGADARGSDARGADAHGSVAAGPACVTIVWGDGTVTTVHPPRTSPPGDLPLPAGPAD
jgi:hypothetical protein